MAIFLQDGAKTDLPKAVPDLSALPVFKIQAATSRHREKEVLTRSMIAYQRAIKPLGQSLIRETAKSQEQQAHFCQKLEELQASLSVAERRLLLLIRAGGNISTAYREKLEILASIKELKERHGHLVEKNRQRQQHQRQSLEEYKQQVEACQEQLNRHSELLSSRRKLSISFDDSDDDDDEAKVLGRKVTWMQRLQTEGRESPTEILLKDLKAQEKAVLESIRDRERLAQILRVEGMLHLQHQLASCGFSTASELASMTAHQLASLPFTKPEKNILQSCSRTARERRGLPTEAAASRGAAALLTSRAYDALFSHRVPVGDAADLKIREQMEAAVRGRAEQQLLELSRGPRGLHCMAMADADGWTLLHRACIPNQPKASRPKSPLRVYTPSSAEMQKKTPSGIGLPYSRAPASPSHRPLRTPRTPRSPRSSIQGLLGEPSPEQLALEEEMAESAGMVRLLLAAKADVHATNKYGRAPLHYAAMEGNFGAALLLLQAGAVPDLADDHGMTPAQHCILMRKGDWERMRDYFQKILDPPEDEPDLGKSGRRKLGKGKGKSGKGKGKKKR